MNDDYDLQTEYIREFWKVVERAGRSVSTHIALSHIKLLLAVINDLESGIRQEKIRVDEEALHYEA